jgi:hypothetical protein
VTAWDSRPFNIEGSTLLLREKVSDRVAACGCKRALGFVDACATKFAPLVQARDVVSMMDAAELKDFLFFRHLSRPYPSPEHSHGMWTYFLLQALTGKAEGALGPGRYLTATSLQDYLRCRTM